MIGELQVSLILDIYNSSPKGCNTFLKNFSSDVLETWLNEEEGNSSNYELDDQEQNTTISWVETLVQGFTGLIEEAVKFESEEKGDNEVTERKSSVCMAEMWNCMSGVVETSIPMLSRQGGVLG